MFSNTEEDDTMEYTPKPLDTSDIVLPESLSLVVEMLAENTHDIWGQQRIADGWTYGEERDDKEKKHPCLVPYKELPESEKEYDRKTAIEALKVIVALGYNIVGSEKLLSTALISAISAGDQAMHMTDQAEKDEVIKGLLVLQGTVNNYITLLGPGGVAICVECGDLVRGESPDEYGVVRCSVCKG